MRRSPIGVRPILAGLGAILAIAGPAASAGFPWKTFAARPDAWYRSDEARRLAANVLSHQSPRGDWPKNLDTSATPYRGDRAALRGTFDNSATVGEMRFLARAFIATGRDEYRDAFLRALDHILAAQYPNGGWPQSDPPGPGYARHITFNDDTMVNLMELVRDVSRDDGFRFVDGRRREAAGRAFAAGVACILKCQVRVGGRLTVWCAQHDETTLEPRDARSFERASLSGAESAGVLMLLMGLENPGPDVVRAVRAGARWFEESKIVGIRQVVVDGDKKIVPDRAAPPLWARFYEIATNRPFFCGRDGVKKSDVAEIEAERRNGYAWYGGWGRRVLERYARWDREIPIPPAAPGVPPAQAPVGHAEGRSRDFELTYRATVRAIPTGAGTLEVWLPLPPTNRNQTIHRLTIEAPAAPTIGREDRSGNQCLYAHVRSPRGAIAIGWVARVTRREDAGTAGLLGDEERSAALAPEPMVPLDGPIRELALRATAGRTTAAAKARGVYDEVTAMMRYDRSGTGWGRGDALFACDARRGNCTDIHALAIGMARSAGLPARFTIGLSLPAARTPVEAEIQGYHCWAELYVEGRGWVPIDASEAVKDPARREYFFGHHDANRIELSRGRNLTLAPAQRGPALNFFVDPYVEVDGRPYRAVERRVTFRDRDAAEREAPSR